MGNLRSVENLYTYGLEQNRADISRESDGARSAIIYRLGIFGIYRCHASFAPKPHNAETHPGMLHQVKIDALKRDVDPDIAKAFMRAIHYDFDTTGPRDGDAWEIADKKEEQLVSLYTEVGYKVTQQRDGLLLVRKNTF